MTATRPRPQRLAGHLPGRLTLLSAALALSAAPALTACDGETGFTPAPDHELLTQVQNEKYREWSRVPGRDMRLPTNAPHGHQVEIFINAPLVDALANADGLGRTSWPEGSTAVLEGFVDGVTTDLEQVVIMQKRYGVWYWEQYQGDDFESPRFSGRPGVCLGCHNTGQDFTRSFGLPKAVE